MSEYNVVTARQGEDRDSISAARRILRAIVDVVGCSVGMAMITYREGQWLQVVVDDDGFAGPVKPDILAGAIIAGFGGKLTYAGSCPHEGGVVTVIIRREDDDRFSLFIGRAM